MVCLFVLLFSVPYCFISFITSISVFKYFLPTFLPLFVTSYDSAKHREWYDNASCKRWFRRRTLSSCFTHPSKMVYPPGEVYTPPESPEREILPVKTDEYNFEPRDYSYEIEDFKNDSKLVTLNFYDVLT